VLSNFSTAKALRPLLIAAPSSGCGKTSVTLALLAALRRRGIEVAPFKVGPDFIDPGHHTALCGRPSYSLDGWINGEDGVRESFARGCGGSRLVLIEGVMGLFDGARGECDAGSSAEVARWLDARVLLVVDARSQARSVAALVSGFSRFDPRLDFAGVICNRVGSERHRQLLSDALASVPGLPPLLGSLPRRDDLTLPERHLGLVTAEESPLTPQAESALIDWLEAGIDLEALLATTLAPQPLPPRPVVSVAGAPVRIAVPKDEAFCFYYPENLERLAAAGAELCFFSPLHDEKLPEGIAGLYLGGGYPEAHLARLGTNRTLLAEVRGAGERGLPIYAECGGLLLLCQSLQGVELAGLLPGEATMLPQRKALGYREVTFKTDTPLGPAGTTARGHEFHYSELTLPDSVTRAYTLQRPDGTPLRHEGFLRGNILASYVHLHFASNPQLAQNFVASCRRFGAAA